MANKTIITVAVTGAITPSGYKIPETPEQIAQDAYDCWKAGASIVHLHMRDENGEGTMDVARFAETIKLIRAHEDCDIIINCTGSGAGPHHPVTDDQRMEHFNTLDGIEMGSYDAGSMNWMSNKTVFMNSPVFLEKLGDCMIERGIKPELEVFDAGMLNVVEINVKNGHLKTPCHYQFCLGVQGGMPATVESLQYLSSHIPAGSTWSAFGVGKGHMPVLYGALALGGHVRVGLEDNVVYGKDANGQKIIATNVMLVERAARAIREFGNEVATPAEAREMLGIPALVR